MVVVISRNHLFQSCRTVGGMPTHARVVRTLLAYTQINASLFQRHEEGDEFSSRSRSRVRAVRELVRGQRPNDSHKARELLFPSPDEKFSITQISSIQLSWHKTSPFSI